MLWQLQFFKGHAYFMFHKMIPDNSVFFLEHYRKHTAIIWIGVLYIEMNE